jgi:galactose mutarotase-like enzyme
LNTTIRTVGFTAIINGKGAELISFRNNHNDREYIWNGDPAFWGKHSPVLFPIVGTLKNNTYNYDNKSYHLSRHDFARDLEFTLIATSENSATFSLSSTKKTREKYPFDFELQLIYTLQDNKLTLSYNVINKNDTKMPFAIGAHPAFALPEKFENYTLFFDKNENLTSYQLENDLLSDKTFEIKTIKNNLPLTYSLFENDALIFKKIESKLITLIENQNPLLKVRYDDFYHLGLWTKPNAKFICIEPWLGYSDTNTTSGNIMEKEAIQFIDAKETFNCSFSVEIL